MGSPAKNSRGWIRVGSCCAVLVVCLVLFIGFGYEREAIAASLSSEASVGKTRMEAVGTSRSAQSRSSSNSHNSPHASALAQKRVSEASRTPSSVTENNLKNQVEASRTPSSVAENNLKNQVEVAPSAPTPAADAKPSRKFVDITGMSDCEILLKHMKPAGRSKCNGPFKVKGVPQVPNASQPRMVAVVIRGEAFRRNAGMYDRTIDVTENTLGCQLNASASHLRYIVEPFESCGLIVEVFIDSWIPQGEMATEAMEKMKDEYKGRAIWARWEKRVKADPLKNTQGKGQGYNFAQGIGDVARRAHKMGVKYDAIFNIRADLILKQSILGFSKQVKSAWKHVLFAFHEWELGGGFPGKIHQQRLPDTMFWIPWVFANCILANGWAEHNWASVKQFIGEDALDLFMPDEYHDANTGIDRNPLYEQACRPQQQHDIHGGYAFGFFNIESVTAEPRMKVALDSVIKSLSKQGRPPILQPTGKSFHGWGGGGVQKSWKQLLAPTCFESAMVQSTRFDPVLKDADTSDTAGWGRWAHSMNVAAYLLLKNPQGFITLLPNNPAYQYDRVILVRSDYSFTSGRISAYDLDTKVATYVGFGAKMFPSVPTIVVTSHRGLHLLGTFRIPYRTVESKTAESAMAEMQKVLKMPVKEMCNPC